MIVSLLGIVTPLLVTPVALLYMIWVDSIIAMKIVASAAVIFSSCLVLGIICEGLYEDFYEEVKE